MKIEEKLIDQNWTLVLELSLEPEKQSWHNLRNLTGFESKLLYTEEANLWN